MTTWTDCSEWLRSARVLLLSLALIATVTACDSTDPGDDANVEEFISDVRVTLTDPGGSQFAVALFDESGTQQPNTPPALDLEAGVTYSGSITFENRFADDPDEQDVTAEVRAEAVEHQVFYVPGGDAADDVTVTVTDEETDYAAEIEGDDTPRDGVPVGLTFDLVVSDTPSASSGEIRVVLGHYDERDKASDESVGDVPEIDVEVAFPFTITAP